MDTFDDFGAGMGLGDDMPVGFEVQGTASLDLPASVYEATEVAGISSVWDEETNHEEEEKIVKAAMAPGGYYDICGLDEDESQREADVIVMTPEGLRPVRQERHRIRLRGRGIREVDGKTYQPFLSVRICPVPAYGKDENGNPTTSKLASDFKMWIALKKAYVLANHLDVKTARINPRAVIAWARTAPLKFRTFQGSDSLIVLDIVPVLG
jgi:hypothetical protein